MNKIHKFIDFDRALEELCLYDNHIPLNDFNVEKNYEVCHLNDSTKVVTFVTNEVMEKLLEVKFLKKAILLFPGMAPFEALISVNNRLALNYEVLITYKTRPDDPIEY